MITSQYNWYNEIWCMITSMILTEKMTQSLEINLLILALSTVFPQIEAPANRRADLVFEEKTCLIRVKIKEKNDSNTRQFLKRSCKKI